MTKTPEQMAKQYVEQENLEYEEAAGSYYGFIAGYKAGYESLREQLQSLESQLRQANGMVMKLEAER